MDVKESVFSPEKPQAVDEENVAEKPQADDV
jgi:hypothetical protein